MTKFLLSNNVIDIFVQKGDIPGMSESIWQTSVITETIRDAWRNTGELAVI